MKPSTPTYAVATVQETPPVVAETADTDTQNAYDQKASRRKGLLSTILSRKHAAAAAGAGASQTAGSQSTLG